LAVYGMQEVTGSNPTDFIVAERYKLEAGLHIMALGCLSTVCKMYA
jgi:hypothetical protein